LGLGKVNGQGGKVHGAASRRKSIALCGVKGIGHTRILGKRITNLPRIGPDETGFFMSEGVYIGHV
jgi:hypothetical protein